MSVEEIKGLAIALKDKRDRKKELEDQLDSLNEEIKQIEEHELNDLLLEDCLTELTTDGLVIKRSEVFRGKTSSETKDDFQYLFDTDNEGALKQEIIINMVDHPLVAAVLDEHNIDYQMKYSIHHATLSSIIRGLVAEGLLSSEDLENKKIYVQPKITVKPVKK